MIYPDLVTYLRDETQRGVSAALLEQTLADAGWRQIDIDNALHDVAAGLHPVTAGASIHEDLAQVRGMVAHLASRVKVLEVQLVSAGALEMQRELPGPVIRSRAASWLRHGAALLVGAAVFGILWYWAPVDSALLLGGVGLGSLFVAFLAMHIRWAWAASLATDIAMAVLLWVLYSQRNAMEWTTAVALALLGVVMLVVIERWTDRLAR